MEKIRLEKAKSIIQEEHVDAIVTTGPPHSAHLIGLDLKRQLNLPWVADMEILGLLFSTMSFFLELKQLRKKINRLKI